MSVSVYRAWVVLRLLPVFGLLALAAPAPAQGQARPEAREVDEHRLAALFTTRGYTPRRPIKALVVRLDHEDDGSYTPSYFDYQQSADDRDNWWPAATIQLYAAIAALEKLHELEFPIDSWVTFEYEDGPVTQRMDQLVHHAIVNSSPAAFDRLVEFVGIDRLNTEFFVAANGFEDTVLLRAYAGRYRDENTGRSVHRFSPRIVLRRGNHRRVLPAREITGQYSCPHQGNCTSLFELAEVMRRLMLHEELPEAERFDLDAADLLLLRGALANPRSGELAELMASAFGETQVDVFHKPGFAGRWVSAVFFVHRPDTDERWLVSVAGTPTRRSLDQAVTTIGAILAAGELR